MNQVTHMSQILGSKSWLKPQKQWNSAIRKGDGNVLFSRPWYCTDCSWSLLNLFHQENLTFVGLATRKEPKFGIKKLAKPTKITKFNGSRRSLKALFLHPWQSDELLLTTFEFISSRKFNLCWPGDPIWAEFWDQKVIQQTKNKEMKPYWKHTQDEKDHCLGIHWSFPNAFSQFITTTFSWWNKC